MPANQVEKTWGSVTLASDELWQVSSPVGGTVIVDTEAVEADRVGIILENKSTIQFSSGTVVYFKKNHDLPVTVRRIAI